MSLSRGRFVDAPVEALTTATVHPSSILRAPDDETRRTELRAFVKDLSKVARALEAGAGADGP